MLKRLCFIVFCCLMMWENARAEAQYLEMLKIRCLPEVGEFRAEVILLSRDGLIKDISLLKKYNLLNWERKSLSNEVWEAELDYVEECVIDGNKYKFDFYEIDLNPEMNDYSKGLIIKRNGEYWGDIGYLGSSKYGNINAVSIIDKKVKVSGEIGEFLPFTYVEKYFDDETFSLVDILAKPNFINKDENNVIEVDCFEDVGQFVVSFRNYSQEKILPKNYYYIKNGLSVECGIFNIKFVNEGDIKVLEHNTLKKTLKMNSNDMKMYKILRDNDEIRAYYYDVNNGDVLEYF